ncbi:MAG: hypothetical protein OEL78_01735 [Hyphomicrobiales bacterium]|nr:hypothetical protein [Hyphomicrobiales bacterium]
MRLVLNFEPLLPWPLTISLALALVLVVALVAWQRLRGAAFRAAACALLIAALFNPVLLRETRDRLPGIVTLITDESPSQTLDGRDDQTEAALAALRERITALGQFDIREVRAGGDAEADGTELFSALTGAMDDVPPGQIAGAIMVTDGVVHDAPEAAADLGFSAPLHVLVTGREGEADRRIVLHRAPRYAILGEPQTIDYRVIDPALAQGERLSVTLRVDGEPVAVDRVGVGETRTMEIPIDHAGRTIVELEVEAAGNELTLDNNVAVAVIDVVREHLRVLLVSGEPHAGERTWRNVLKSDAAVDLVHFTILRPPEKQDGTPIHELSLIAFPTRELFSEKIDEFDLIIFDRYQRRGVLPILYFDNLARYVRDGGAILLAAGPDYASGTSLYRTPLGTILPAVPSGGVVEQPYRPALTATGQRHPVTRDLPGNGTPPSWSRWFRLIEADAIAGDVAMNGPDDWPLLVLSREDEGRVAILLSDHAWLWARGFEGGGPHGPLLRRLVHWLMQEPELEEEALTARTAGRDLVIERQTLAETVPGVAVTGPDGEPQALTLAQSAPGLWRATLKDAAFGLHRIENGDLSALAHVGPANPREYQEVVSSTERLAPLVEETGGGIARLGPPDDIAIPRIVAVSDRAPAAGSGWIGLRLSQATVLRSVDRIPLLSGVLGLALLIGGFAALWYREGR